MKCSSMTGEGGGSKGDNKGEKKETGKKLTETVINCR